LKGEQLLVPTLGERAPAKHIGNLEFRYIPVQHDSGVVASYYQASDVYVQAAMAETFGLAVVEAMASGTRVVATAVGGIPEVVEHGQTGFLVPPGAETDMAKRISDLLVDESARRRIAKEVMGNSPTNALTSVTKRRRT